MKTISLRDQLIARGFISNPKCEPSKHVSIKSNNQKRNRAARAEECRALKEKRNRGGK